MSISIIFGPIRVEDVFTMTLLKYVVSYVREILTGGMSTIMHPLLKILNTPIVSAIFLMRRLP